MVQPSAHEWVRTWNFASPDFSVRQTSQRIRTKRGDLPFQYSPKVCPLISGKAIGVPLTFRPAFLSMPPMFPLRIDRAFAAAFVTALVVFLLHFFHIVDFHELDAVDLRFRLRGKQAADSRITVVTIDDASLGLVGGWPWPRGIHALFLNIISRYHPKGIFLDILFTEKSPDSAEDQKLSEATKTAGNVILPFYYVSESPFEAKFPIDLLKEAAAGTGYVNAQPDADGRVRRIKTMVETDQGPFYAASVVLTQPKIKSKDLWINYPGDQSAYQRVSFGEVTEAAGLNQEETLKKLFAEKIVLIGHTATGTSDLITTPFSTLEPGVFIHAGAVHTLLGDKALSAVSEAMHFLILLICCAFAALCAQKLSPLHGLISVLSFGVAYLIFNFLSFVFLQWILPFFVPLTALVVCYSFLLFMKYLEERMHREMMGKELEAAADIQQKFLAPAFSQCESLDVAYECRFSKQVGGDLYDWVELDNNRWGFCVGDVSGKGMPAAIYMAKALSDFRSIEKKAKEPGEVCEMLNRRLIADGQSSMFLTFLYVVIDLNLGKIAYSSAGHEPMIFFEKKSGEVKMIQEAQGMPLGVFDEAKYETAEISFGKGDGFVLVSDGVKELRNPRRQEFGLERLRQTVQELTVSFQSSKNLIESLFKTLLKHQESAPPHDDRTLLCVVRVQ